jgi:stage V sporulation protein G
MSNIKLEVRVYPLDNPQGSTKAFANVGIEDLVAINGIRVVSGEKGDFVAMPQSKDKNGEYHDIAFPINAELRKELNRAVLSAYKDITKERGQSLGEQIRAGQEQAAAYKQERAAAPRQAAMAKGSPGIGD